MEHNTKWASVRDKLDDSLARDTFAYFQLEKTEYNTIAMMIPAMTANAIFALL